jgi:hypothetical protein
MFRRLTEELAVSLIAWKRTRNTSAGLRSIARVYRPKISLDAAQSFPHSQASTRERVMHNDTDWRRESAMLTNQSNGRGWAFDPKPEETSFRPWFIAGACVLLFVAMCAICAVA